MNGQYLNRSEYALIAFSPRTVAGLLKVCSVLGTVMQGMTPCWFLSILPWSRLSQATVQDICRRKMKPIQIAAVIQKALSPGMI